MNRWGIALFATALCVSVASADGIKWQTGDYKSAKIKSIAENKS